MNELLLSLTLLDIILFFMLLLVTIAVTMIGIYLNKKAVLKVHVCKDKARFTAITIGVIEYWLMGRRLTLPLFVATLTTTWYGGIFGVTQIAFEHGIYNLFSQGVAWYVGYIVFAIFIVQRIHKMQVPTIPELIARKCGTWSGKFAAIMLFFKSLPISYAISIGAFLKVLYGIELSSAIIISCGLVTIYCCFGGLRSLILRDVVQCLSMYVAVVAVIAFSYVKLGGYDYLRNTLPYTHFTLGGNHGSSAVLLWFIVATITTFISPVFYQRCMAAKTPEIAKSGIIIATIFWFIFDCCTTFGGMYARAFLPNIDSLYAYLLYGIEILPTGFKGVFLAGIVATILSTLDAFLFITSSLLAYDLAGRRMRDSNIARVGALIICGTLTTVIAINFNGKIEQAWLTFEVYTGAPLIMPIVWSYLIPHKLRDWQCMASFITSMLAIRTYSACGFTIVETFYIGIVVSAMTIFMGYYMNKIYVRFIQKTSKL